MIQKNHIKNCDVMVRYIDIAQEIWGKDVDALKFDTNQTKHNPVAGDIIKVLKELLELNRTVFLVVAILTSQE